MADDYEGWIMKNDVGTKTILASIWRDWEKKNILSGQGFPTMIQTGISNTLLLWVHVLAEGQIHIKHFHNLDQSQLK